MTDCMGKKGWLAAFAIACLLLAMLLGACSGTDPAGSSAAASEGNPGDASLESSGDARDPLDPQVRAEIEQALASARENAYKNVSFDMETITTVTGVEDGKTVQQGVMTTTKGQLRQGKKAAMHFDYTSQSSSQLGKTTYELFVDKENVLIRMDGKVYVSGMDDATPESYFASVTDVASEEEVGQMLDIASSYKIEHGGKAALAAQAASADETGQSGQSDKAAEAASADGADQADQGNQGDQSDQGDPTNQADQATQGDPTNQADQATQGDQTVITITVDASKLSETDLVDASSLPDGSKIATLVANYVISGDNHLKTVRLMSSTTGVPTYRVNQTYEFSDYDETKLPKWPKLSEEGQLDLQIETDEDGNPYVIGDDGIKYIIDSIDDDGTVHAHAADQASDGSAQEGALIAYDDPAAVAAQGTAAAGGSGAANGSGKNASNSGSSGGKSSKSNKTGSLGKPQYSEGDAANAVKLDEPQYYEGEIDVNGEEAATGDSSSEQGRAYITAADGTIHYLDEPGSEIRDVGGSRVFIDANGEWYFLNEE